MKKVLYIIVGCVGLLASCKKGDLVENTAYERLAPADPKYAYLKIINLTPGSPTVNFYMDGPKFSAGYSTSGIENVGFAYNGLFPDLGYAVTTPGTHNLKAKIIPTAAADPNLEVMDQQIAPEAGKYYTIYTSGIYTVANKKIPSSIMIEDSRPALDTTKVFLRLANMYNGSPNLDMVKDAATGAKIISNVAYGTSSGWNEVPNIGPGTAPSFKIFFNVAGTTTTLVPAGFTGTVTKGRSYTIYVRGVLGNPTYPLAASSFTSFY
jgi:hypothetical protein